MESNQRKYHVIVFGCYCHNPLLDSYLGNDSLVVRWQHLKIFSAMAVVSLTSSAIGVLRCDCVANYVDCFLFLSPPARMLSFSVPREVLFADALDTEDRIYCSAR